VARGRTGVVPRLLTCLRRALTPTLSQRERGSACSFPLSPWERAGVRVCPGRMTQRRIRTRPNCAIQRGCSPALCQMPSLAPGILRDPAHPGGASAPRGHTRARRRRSRHEGTPAILAKRGADRPPAPRRAAPGRWRRRRTTSAEDHRPRLGSVNEEGRERGGAACSGPGQRDPSAAGTGRDSTRPAATSVKYTAPASTATPSGIPRPCASTRKSDPSASTATTTPVHSLVP
jgi:hypothetical protein